jgi:hypothetical protein
MTAPQKVHGGVMKKSVDNQADAWKISSGASVSPVPSGGGAARLIC